MCLLQTLISYLYYLHLISLHSFHTHKVMGIVLQKEFFWYLIYRGKKLKVFHKFFVWGAPNDVCCRVNVTDIGYMVTRIKFLLLNDVMFGEWAVFLNFYRTVPDMLLQAAVGVRCVFSVKPFWHVFPNPLLSSPLRALARHLVL